MVLTSKKITIDNERILYGSIEKEQLYFDYPEWQEIENNYEPSTSIIKELKTLDAKAEVDVFLGTWCGDSKREVPVFFKIIDAAQLEDNLDISIWAMDRGKKLDDGPLSGKNIEFVPTFVFHKSGEEIGRIIEMPDDLFEKDMLKILRSIDQ